MGILTTLTLTTLTLTTLSLITLTLTTWATASIQHGQEDQLGRQALRGRLDPGDGPRDHVVIGSLTTIDRERWWGGFGNYGMQNTRVIDCEMCKVYRMYLVYVF